MAAQSGQAGPFRFHEAPIATPIAIPTPSQTPTLPAITPKTAPNAAPRAIPTPAYFGLTFITHSYADFASRVSKSEIPLPHALQRGGRGVRPYTSFTLSATPAVLERWRRSLLPCPAVQRSACPRASRRAPALAPPSSQCRR